MIFFFFFHSFRKSIDKPSSGRKFSRFVRNGFTLLLFFTPMTIFPSRMEGKIAINLRERWKNENSIGISVNKGFALLRSLVTTLPLFLDKVTFRVISPSISPQEI